MKFKDKDIRLFWENPGAFIPKRVPSNIRRVLYRKLQILDAAYVLNDLGALPGNRLEALKGKRLGQCSIRVNN